MFVDKFFTHQRSCGSWINKRLPQTVSSQISSNCSRFSCHLCSRLLSPQSITKSKHCLSVYLSSTPSYQHSNGNSPAFPHIFLPLCFQNWFPSRLSWWRSPFYRRSYRGGWLRGCYFFLSSPSGFSCFRPFLTVPLSPCHEGLHLNLIFIFFIVSFRKVIR